jgi:hypothetical protein
MSSDTGDRRTRFYNRLETGGLIGSAVTFGSLIALVYLPVAPNVGMVLAGVVILLMVVSVVAMIGAIVARDIPTWRKNRWRFSMSTLLNVMLAVAMVLGAITAAERDVGPGRMLIALGGYFIVAVITNTLYINWSRNRYFREMHAADRYLDWSTVAAALSRGEGTLLVGKYYHLPMVWWCERRISSSEDASAAIESDVIVTICPHRKQVANWLKATFPTVPVIEIGARTKLLIK